jgi:hypothetical protein
MGERIWVEPVVGERLSVFFTLQTKQAVFGIYTGQNEEIIYESSYPITTHPLYLECEHGTPASVFSRCYH